MSSIIERLNVTSTGDPTAPTLLFAHGFGCDQSMWRLVAPAFESTHQVVLFDLAGCGRSAPDAYSTSRHDSLAGYADDVLELCRELDLSDVIFVGHSVSAMVGVLASVRDPSRFAKLVLVGPSPRYVDDDEYVGGFSAADIEGLLDALAANWLGWSATMAPVIAANPDRPEVGAELTAAFCRMDPDIARRFAHVTFLSDNREDLARVAVPALVLQCAEDAIAPQPVGEYVHQHLPESRLVLLGATGHCPQLSAPGETIAAIRTFV
jgi:sigma-B regulation protein RsbQ